MESLSKADRSTAFVFGREGDLLGKVSGQAIYGGASVLSRESLTTTSSQRVTTLTPDGSAESDIGYENIVEAATGDPAGGAAAMWFNSGVVDGVYSNRFVTSYPDAGVRTGFVPGVTRMVGHCGDRIYGIAQEAYIGTSGPPTENTLYEYAAETDPKPLHTWDFAEDFLPASRNAVCTPDGNFLLGLYASDESRKDRSGGVGLTLVRVNVHDGTRTQTSLEMVGISEDTRGGIIHLSGGRLHWLTADGKAVSADWDSDAPQVVVDWELPSKEIGSVTATESGELVILSKDTSWGIERFEITSGDPTSERISLSWLDSILGATTESGKSTYTSSGLAYIP
ncbi:hypothetical protein [Rhodococcus sp. NPDC058521]|uniref:hypothetical protein n=1 Tax=Rhodococcus sp. NPDC058521 TaxID=3346536 RepID=UPI003646D902